MSITANVITAAGIALAGVTTAMAAAVRAGREHRAEAAPAPSGPAPDAYLACHTTTCGHMSTPHDRTAAGLVCRGCGTTQEAL